MSVSQLSSLTEDELKREKLLAEIEEIRFRITNAGDALTLERRRRWRNFLTAWVAIVASVVGIYVTTQKSWVEWDDFKDKKAREREVQVTETMVNIVKSLASTKDDDEVTRGTAALLFASYERDAVPILLWSLGRAKDPGPIIEAFNLLKQKNKVGEAYVLQELRDYMRHHFSVFYQVASPETMQPLLNYPIAVGALWKSNPTEAVAMLDEWDQIVKKVKTLLPPPEKALVREALAKSRSGLQTTPIAPVARQ